MTRSPAKRITRSLALGALALASLATALPASAQTSTADPFKDKRYMSGHRDVLPPEVPEELQNVDALTRIRGVKRVTACADPFAFPSTEMTEKATGYDVDLLQSIAKDEGWETFFIWVNTAGRGGMNRAFRTSIRKGICDVFLGLGTGGMEDVLGKSKLTLLAPAFGVSYVLATYDPTLKGQTLKDLAKNKVHTGATYFSPTDTFLTENGVEHETFPQSRRAIGAMAEGKVRAVLIPSTMMADAKRDFPDREMLMLESFEPKDMEWNSTWAIKTTEVQLREFLDTRISEYAANGRLKDILGTYGIPYVAPAKH